MSDEDEQSIKKTHSSVFHIQGFGGREHEIDLPEEIHPGAAVVDEDATDRAESVIVFDSNHASEQSVTVVDLKPVILDVNAPYPSMDINDSDFPIT